MQRPLNINPSISQWSYQQKKLPRESPNIKILGKPETATVRQILGASRSSLIATKLTKPATSSTTWRRGNRSCRRQAGRSHRQVPPKPTPTTDLPQLKTQPLTFTDIPQVEMSSCRCRWFQGEFLKNPWRCGWRWECHTSYHSRPFTGNLTKIHQIHKFDYLWTSFKPVC